MQALQALQCVGRTTVGRPFQTVTKERHGLERPPYLLTGIRIVFPIARSFRHPGH